MSYDDWRHQLLAATTELFRHKISDDRPVIVPKSDRPQIPAFMYAKEQSRIWEEIGKATASGYRTNGGEVGQIKADMREFIQSSIANKSTLVEFGSGSAKALADKTGEALSRLGIQNYVTIEMSPDYVSLPSAVIGRGPNFPTIRNIMAIQSDFTLPLPWERISETPDIQNKDILLFSVGSSFCNFLCIPEKGFPEQEYIAQFKEYAKFGSYNSKNNVFFYISYFRGNEKQYQDGYADSRTAAWFMGVPYLINGELKPKPANNGLRFIPNAYGYDLIIQPERYLVAGSLLATQDQSCKIQNGEIVELNINRNDRLILNTHYAPPPELWGDLAKKAGWRIVETPVKGPYQRILLRLEK